MSGGQGGAGTRGVPINHLSPLRGPHHLLGRSKLTRRASPGPTETSSGSRPCRESASASLGAQIGGRQAGPGCARLRVGARASAAACVSGSAAEPPWLSPPALFRGQLLACPRQSPGSAGRALPPRVRLSFYAASLFAHVCDRLPSTQAQLGLFSRATWHCPRIAASAHPWRPSPAPGCSVRGSATSGTETCRGSGLAPRKQTQEGSEYPSLRSSLLPALGSNWRGTFMRPTLQS